MSLEITIKLPGAEPHRLKTIADASLKAGKLEAKARRTIPLFGGITHFSVAGAHEGLDEKASERGDFLLFNEETRRSLSELLLAFGKLTAVFTVYSSWSGELPKRETQITLDRLAELVKENHLGNRVTYWVKPAEVTLRPSEPSEEPSLT